MEVTTVTTVAAQGEAEAPFNLASFSLQISRLASTVPAAKSRLGSVITQLETALTDMQHELSLEFVKNSVRTSSHVQEKFEWNNKTNEQVSKGHEFFYSMSFDIADMDKVDEVFDTLTSLDFGSPNQGTFVVNPPAFRLRKSSQEALNKKALRHAFTKVTERFSSECQVLGLESNNFEIATWSATYDDSRRGTRSYARLASAARAEAAPMGGSAPAISFNTGLATVTVNLEVAFQHKSQ